jgi:hypothetical protein
MYIIAAYACRCFVSWLFTASSCLPNTFVTKREIATTRTKHLIVPPAIYNFNFLINRPEIWEKRKEKRFPSPFLSPPRYGIKDVRFPFPNPSPYKLKQGSNSIYGFVFLLSRPRLSRKPEGDEKGGGSGK